MEHTFMAYPDTKNYTTIYDKGSVFGIDWRGRNTEHKNWYFSAKKTFKSKLNVSDGYAPTAMTRLRFFETGTYRMYIAHKSNIEVPVYWSGNRQLTYVEGPRIVGMTSLMQKKFFYGLSGAANATPSYRKAKLDYSDQLALDALVDGKYQLGIFLAELAQTATLLSKRAKDVGVALLAIRRLDVKTLTRIFWKPKKPFKSSADLYLEYQFGIKPLISDIASIYLLFKEGLDATLDIVGEGMRVDDVADMSTYSSTDLTVTGKSFSITKAYCGIDSYELDALRQLGLSDITSIAWEIVPFSFVIDWFLPIGNFLARLNAPKNVTFKNGYRSTYVEIESVAVKKTQYYTDTRAAPRDHFLCVGHSGSSKMKFYDRTLLSALPENKFLIDLNLGGWHAVTAAALVVKIRSSR
jgi:hypothetical protein